ncbi:ANFB protein, partial [Polyodon spathula]|nr:ANFB protein [Polyodon spathula]
MLGSRLAFCYGFVHLLLQTHLLVCAYPYSDPVVRDTDALKTLLQRLEDAFLLNVRAESLERGQVADGMPEERSFEAEDASQERDAEESAIGYSTQDAEEARLSDRSASGFLNPLRNAKRYSGCFGRRIDRIGSMSALGCNGGSRMSYKRS